MTLYHCDDGNAEVLIHASTQQDAAQQYVDGGSWGDLDRTTWVKVHVWTTDDARRWDIKIPVHPPEPACTEEDEHHWKDNPDVRGHGGGVTITEVCAHCGVYRILDTWAQDPHDGEQGLESVEYRDADPVDNEDEDGMIDDSNLYPHPDDMRF